MSSRTPTECVELATDDAASEADRMDAIHELELANECDELEALARSGDLDGQYRRQALQALASPQCDATLRELVAEGPLADDLRDEAAALLDELAED